MTEYRGITFWGINPDTSIDARLDTNETVLRIFLWEAKLSPDTFAVTYVGKGHETPPTPQKRIIHYDHGEGSIPFSVAVDGEKLLAIVTAPPIRSFTLDTAREYRALQSPTIERYVRSMYARAA